MEVEKIFPRYVVWREKTDYSEILRETGYRSYTLEYRLMKMEGVVNVDPRSPTYSNLMESFDDLFKTISQKFPDEMGAVYDYYLLGRSFRKARLKRGVSQAKIRELFNRGMNFLEVGLVVFIGVFSPEK